MIKKNETPPMRGVVLTAVRAFSLFRAVGSSMTPAAKARIHVHLPLPPHVRVLGVVLGVHSHRVHRAERLPSISHRNFRRPTCCDRADEETEPVDLPAPTPASCDPPFSSATCTRRPAPRAAGTPRAPRHATDVAPGLPRGPVRDWLGRDVVHPAVVEVAGSVVPERVGPRSLASMSLKLTRADTETARVHLPRSTAPPRRRAGGGTGPPDVVILARSGATVLGQRRSRDGGPGRVPPTDAPVRRQYGRVGCDRRCVTGVATAATGTAGSVRARRRGASPGRATGNDSVLGVAPQAGWGPRGRSGAGVAAGGDGAEVDPLAAAPGSRSSSSSSSTAERRRGSGGRPTGARGGAAGGDPPRGTASRMERGARP